MALGKKTGGRQKGVKNAKTIAKSAAKIAAAEAVAGASKGSSRSPTGAPKGISPKDLLLTGMRQAWDRHYRLMDAADKALAEARGFPEASPERAAAMDRAAAIRVEAGEALMVATDTAVKVAPYEHPKLANLDQRVSGNVTVVLKKF